MADDVMKLDKQLADLEKTVATEFHKVGTRFDDVDTQLGRLEQTVAREFYEIGQRFAKVDARFDQVDARFDKVDTRLGRLESAFKVQDDKITKGFRDIADRLDRLATPRRRRTRRR